MKKNELKTIQNNIRNAQNSIELLNGKTYPEFSDKRLKEMFYALNKMILELYDMIEQAEQ